MTVSTGESKCDTSELTFLWDSFFASFTESLNILSQTSRLSVRHSINQSVQCLLRSYKIFGVCGSGLASVVVTSVLPDAMGAMHWRCWCQHGFIRDPLFGRHKEG